MNVSRTFWAGSLLAVAGFASAANPVGAWTGRFLPKVPVLPASAPPAMKARLASELALIKKGRLNLTLKADHTYTMRTVGLPMFGPPDTKGTWSQSGSTVNLVQSGATNRPRPLQMDTGGKQMALTLGKSGSKVVFVR